MGKFHKDLSFGNKYEFEYSKVKGLTKPHCVKNSFYDIITEEGIKYEIKSDRYTYKTGNFCIEFECSNKPSGISITQSDFYGYFVVINDKDYQLYTIPTSYIREIITDKKYNRIMKGGDGYKSKFYLFNKDLFTQFQETLSLHQSSLQC